MDRGKGCRQEGMEEGRGVVCWREEKGWEKDKGEDVFKILGVYDKYQHSQIYTNIRRRERMFS